MRNFVVARAAAGSAAAAACPPLPGAAAAAITLVELDCAAGAEREAHACRVSFDGKHAQMLGATDSLRMRIARFPLPMMTADVMDQDWFASITEKLMWNATIKKEKGAAEEHALPFPPSCGLCAVAPAVSPCPPPSPDSVLRGRAISIEPRAAVRLYNLAAGYLKKLVGYGACRPACMRITAATSAKHWPRSALESSRA